MTTFDIKRDIEIIETGGFFCQGCLLGKPAVVQSQDPRYCQGCYEIFKAEAELLPGRKRPAWVPKTTDSAIKATDSKVEGQDSVSKIIPPIIPPVTDKEVFMKQRGRPRKEGEVSRITRWRRGKEAVQGLLI